MKLLLLIIIFQLSGSLYANSHSINDAKVLGMIADFATEICNDIPLSGSKESIQLSGKAQASLSKLLKKVANVGVDGTVKYDLSEYEGVLQEQLVTTLENNSDCKMVIWKDFQPYFFKKLGEQDNKRKNSTTNSATHNGIGDIKQNNTTTTNYY